MVQCVGVDVNVIQRPVANTKIRVYIETDQAPRRLYFNNSVCFQLFKQMIITIVVCPSVHKYCVNWPETITIPTSPTNDIIL